MNVLFLDYDGVVNTLIWNELGTECTYGNPFHGKVNNFQAVQWVSEFCQKFNYGIVITSTWRRDPLCIQCLQQGGLREDVQILGVTTSKDLGCRGNEIQDWIDNHPETENFIILDDENDMGHLANHLVQCNSYVGFTYVEFLKAKEIHELTEISKAAT